jgi:pimeloyl-ACP methyl ester carboxylesterase
MKTNLKPIAMKKNFIICLLLIPFLFTFQACNTDEPVEKQPTCELVLKIGTSEFKTLLVNFGYPEWADKILYPVEVYKMTYSTTYKGKTIDASGLVCIPVANQSFPVLSFQHGTMVAKSEAPSASFFSQTGMAIASIAATGYVVSYPDLVGFGESSDYFHPYYIKESNTQAVTDMLDAIGHVDKASLSNVAINDSLFLAGYSQGGWITMAVLDELEHQSDKSWNLIAASCGAGPYNPTQVMDYAMEVDEYEHPYYMAYVLLSFIDMGLLTNNIGLYIQEPYASAIPGLFDGTKDGDAIDAQLTKVPSDFYTSDFKDNYSEVKFDALRSAFESNQTYAWNNTTPLLLLHGNDDVYIPKAVSDSIYTDFIAAGSEKVTYVSFPELDHNTAAIPAIIYTLNWFDEFR